MKHLYECIYTCSITQVFFGKPIIWMIHCKHFFCTYVMDLWHVIKINIHCSICRHKQRNIMHINIVDKKQLCVCCCWVKISSMETRNLFIYIAVTLWVLLMYLKTFSKCPASVTVYIAIQMHISTRSRTLNFSLFQYHH